MKVSDDPLDFSFSESWPIRFSKSKILIHSTPIYLEQIASKWSIKEPLNANPLPVYFTPIVHSKIQTQITRQCYGC